MSDFSKPPSTVKVQPKPFKAEIDSNAIQDFKRLLALSKLGPAVYENQQQDRRYGITRDWLAKAKKHWETDYDWRKCEDQINSFPNFTIPIKDDHGHEFTIHFLALFSQKPNAIPIIFFHGWPGSILEFLSMLTLIKSKYPSPEELPYHIIVPSLPGYTFSSSPPLDRDFVSEDMAPLMNKLMIALGFENGYVAQGGDLGGWISRQLGVEAKECKAFHVNFNAMSPPDNANELFVSESEAEGLKRTEQFRKTGSAYAMEHGTRTATIGLVLSSSPLALLSWIGEKFLEWTDEDPPLDQILDSVTLYWLTETYPRCIYPYRSHFSGRNSAADSKPTSPKVYSEKPQGYSRFPKEIIVAPKSWVEQSGNLVLYKEHNEGGHFAAMEKPKLLWGDVEEFIKVAWK